MTAPQLFDTTGMDQTTLSHAALLLSQNLAAGTPTNVTGPYASQLVQMAGASMNAQGNVVSADPSFLQNVGGTLKSAGESALTGGVAGALIGGPVGAVIGSNIGASGAASSKGVSDISTWIESHTANFALIAFGAVIAVAALIYSQRDNIIGAVNKVGRVAVLA